MPTATQSRVIMQDTPSNSLATNEAVVQADAGRTQLAVSSIIMVAKAISADAIVVWFKSSRDPGCNMPRPNG